MAPTNVSSSDDGNRDERLLERYAQGDNGAFQELTRRYYREIFAFIRRFVNDDATAEDVLQETFLLVHRNARSFDPLRRFKPWLYAIAANKARDFLRAGQRRPAQSLDANPAKDGPTEFMDLIDAGLPSPDAGLMTQERIQRVQHILTTLPPTQREIIHLAVYQQIPYKDIAEMLGIPIGTVKSRVHAALANFAKLWATQEKQDGSV
ncbi:MAG: sigma-70 family RNA polymerase sigma factor [Phycisphaerae bacterium]